MKKIKYEKTDEVKTKNEKKIIKFTPDIKINDSQVITINKVWPISGWEINSRVIGITTKKLKK